MFRMKTMLGVAAGCMALVGTWGMAPARAGADDTRLSVTPAVYRVNEAGGNGANIQLVRHYGYYHGGRGWGWGGGYRGYGYRYGGFYRPYYARPFYGAYYGAGPGYGYGYGAGYGYPGYGYGYGGYVGGGCW